MLQRERFHLWGTRRLNNAPRCLFLTRVNHSRGTRNEAGLAKDTDGHHIFNVAFGLLQVKNV